MSEQMIVRIDPDLKTQASHLARAEGKNISQVVRELLEDYVQERDLAGYVDDLWTRIGLKLRRKGIQPKDIGKAIQDVRLK